MIIALIILGIISLCIVALAIIGLIQKKREQGFIDQYNQESIDNFLKAQEKKKRNKVRPIKK